MKRDQLWWDHFFLGMAEYISTASKDPSTKVGAVLVDDKKIVVGLGYNGFARGVEDSEWRLNNRELKYKYVVHAEVNAILMAGDKAKGASLYVFAPGFPSPFICHDCCKIAIQAGIKEIVGIPPIIINSEKAKKWGESLEIARTMCVEAGVEYRGIYQL